MRLWRKWISDIDCQMEASGCSYIPGVEPHAISRRYSNDNAKAYTEWQSDESSIVVPSDIACDVYPRPHSDTDNNCRQYWTDDAGDDDSLSQAWDMARKLGRHRTTRWAGETT